MASPPVGLERRYRRLEDRDNGLKQQMLAQKAHSEAHQRPMNVRTCAKVSPVGRRFADAYEMTPSVIGTGMSGDVMLARQRCMTGSSEEVELGRQESSTCCCSSSSSSSKSRDAEEADGRRVAVKTLSKRRLTLAQQQRLSMEVNIYLRMDHINVARLLQVFEEPEQVYLVMEFCSGGTLLDRQLRQGRFSEPEAACAMLQILSAVNYCHSHPAGKVCHGDLKHQNFVYASRTEGAPLKLVDFGLSHVLSTRQPRSRDCAGSLQYCAPEILLQKHHDQSCDMWSLGVIAYSLLSNHMPHHGQDVGELTRSIARGAPGLFTEEEWENVSDLGKDFVAQLMSIDPSQRPTAEVALHHPWLATAAPSSRDLRGGSRQVESPTSSGEFLRDILEKVRQFAYESAARRASASLAVNSEDMVLDRSYAKLETHFRDLDTDLSGTISVAEFAEALHQVLGVSPDESRFVFERLDTDGDGEIEYSEFLAAAMGMQLLHHEGLVRLAFERLDLDNDGSIELRELPRVLGRKFCGQPSESIFKEDVGGESKRLISRDSFERRVKCSLEARKQDPMQAAS